MEADSSTVTSVVAQLAAEAKRRRAVRSVQVIAAIAVVILGVLSLVGILGSKGGMPGYFNLIHVVNLATLFGSSYLLDRDAAAQATLLEDPRATGVLLQIVGSSKQGAMAHDEEIVSRAAVALVRLLPKLTRADVSQITADQWQAYFHSMVRYPDRALRLALVDALYRNQGFPRPAAR